MKNCCHFLSFIDSGNRRRVCHASCVSCYCFKFNLAIVKILQDIAAGKGPEKSIFIVGYTGWAAGQLEFELENNLWIITAPDKELIFSLNDSNKWTKALNIVGISSNYFMPFAATS